MIAQSTAKVLVTGVFDVLHQEHINFLKNAKKLGAYLVVGIESDFRVKKIKGEGRPINKQDERKQALQKLKIADEVMVLPEKFETYAEHKRLIEDIKPDFLAVSSHTLHLDEKRKIIEECGGKLVVVHQHNPKISSTQILNETVL